MFMVHFFGSVNFAVNISQFRLLFPQNRTPDRSMVIKNARGGALVFEVGYHSRKKINVIRVVFQDQAMYARASFRGAKTCKIGNKGVFFCHTDKFSRTSINT